MQKIKVLFLPANPEGTSFLKLDEEARNITGMIRAAEYRDALELVTRWAVRVGDLQQELLGQKPHILHFSGHGSPSEEIFLADDHGKSKAISKEALQHLLSVLKDNLQLVVLNACYSRPQAEAIIEHIDCAVGMNRAIGDQAAILFAGSLYRALGFGRSVNEAFELGRNALLLEGIPEDKTPELLHRAGVDVATLCLIGPSDTGISPKVVPAAEKDEQSKAPLRLFYCYAHEDEALRKKLQNHLAVMRRQGFISEWHDREITAGTDWKGQIDENLDCADVILLLVSDAFLGSDYCYDKEMKRALERHEDEQDRARIIPVILRDCDWTDTDFGKLQALPRSANAITGAAWHNADEALTDVAKGIRRVVEEMRNRL